MGALAQQSEIYSDPSSQILELDVTLEISRIASSALEMNKALDAIAATALKIRGIRQLQLEEPPSLVWGPVSKPGTHGSAVAEVAAHGRKWGELRLLFDLQSTGAESPLRFAKFIAQQIAGILNRDALLQEQDSWRERIERLRRIVAKRKAIHNAKAILSRTRRISEFDALALLCKYSRESGRSLHQVSEAFIFSDGEKWRPVRRLTAVARDAATTSNFAAATVRTASSR